MAIIGSHVCVYRCKSSLRTVYGNSNPIKSFLQIHKAKIELFPLAVKFSCICHTIKMVSLVPLPFINPNCISSVSICCWILYSDFLLEARYDQYQWLQLHHMQIICNSLQTNNHTGTTTPLYRSGYIIATTLRPLLGPLRIPKCVCCVGVCMMCNCTVFGSAPSLILASFLCAKSRGCPVGQAAPARPSSEPVAGPQHTACVTGTSV